jgi:hypothetical protein
MLYHEFLKGDGYSHGGSENRGMSHIKGTTMYRGNLHGWTIYIITFLSQYCTPETLWQ